MRIVFMGTPDFAVPSLTKLNESAHEVPLVVTQPDRPAGRGRRLTPPAVKTAALSMGLPLEQHDDVNADAFVERLASVAPDLLVVVAFGQILRRALLDAPAMGAVNVHASLLPAYRGTAPINWAIVNGERETGVTTMFMAEKVDAGEIILVRRTPIGERETAGELSDRLAELGAELLLETIALIEAGEAPREAQDVSRASYARKLTRADGEVDWSQPTRRVLDGIRGMTPWPGAYTWYRGKRLGIERAEAGEGAGGDPGRVVAVTRESVDVSTSDGVVRLLDVRPEGRSPMSADAFARGYKPEVGSFPFSAEDGSG